MAARTKGTPGRRTTVTSSLNEISTNQLGTRVVVRGEALLSPPPPLSTAGFWTGIYKTMWTVFSSRAACLYLGDSLDLVQKDHILRVGDVLRDGGDVADDPNLPPVWSVHWVTVLVVSGSTLQSLILTMFLMDLFTNPRTWPIEKSYEFFIK